MSQSTSRPFALNELTTVLQELSNIVLHTEKASSFVIWTQPEPLRNVTKNSSKRQTTNFRIDRHLHFKLASSPVFTHLDRPYHILPEMVLSIPTVSPVPVAAQSRSHKQEAGKTALLNLWSAVAQSLAYETVLPEENQGLRPETGDFDRLLLSSMFGVDGSMTLNMQDFQSDLLLKDRLVDPEVEPDLHSERNANSPELAHSTFMVIGRGGIPSDPAQALSYSGVRVPWVELKIKRIEEGSR